MNALQTEYEKKGETADKALDFLGILGISYLLHASEIVTTHLVREHIEKCVAMNFISF